MKRPKALFFDVFGTLVDWREGVAREAAALLGPSIDAHGFADAWRGEYQPGMERIRSGAEPYATLDVVHRRNLDRILPRFGLGGLAEPVRDELVKAWHRLDAWPDVAPALRRLAPHILLAPVSNGHIALIVALKRRNDLPFDAVLGAEVAGDYKPKPRVYLRACEAFALAPADCMMVAAHSDDLAAARACGLMTGFVARPDERGPGRGETEPRGPVDAAGRDLGDLAERILS